MTTEAHTPGPWNAYAGAVFTGTREEPTFIARLAKGKNLGRIIKCGETRWMNQQLIAAAPDMLDALRQTLDIVEAECASDYLKIYRPGWARAIKKARAAIAKATD